MSAEAASSVNSVNGHRVKRRWFTIPQIIMYTTGFALSLALTERSASAWYMLIALLFVWLASPSGAYGRMVLFTPLHWHGRRRLAKNKNVVAKMSPRSNPSGMTVPQGEFREAFHGKINFQIDGVPDMLPVILDAEKRRGSLMVTSTGLRVGAGGDEQTRAAHSQIIADGIRDTINGNPAATTVTSLRVRRPGDVYRALAYTLAEMADDVRDAPEGTGHARAREYALERAWSGHFDDTHRIFVVSTGLGPLRHHTQETILGTTGRERRSLPSNDDVFSSPLWLAAERIQAALASANAESPEIADAARQAQLLQVCLTTHPEDLESTYRRAQRDDELVRAEGAIDPSRSTLVRHGAFPRRWTTGDDFVLVGRTYLRILNLIGPRDDQASYDFGEEFVAAADYPVIYSTVSTSVPGKWERYKAEERARVEEVRLKVRAQDYEDVPARYRADLENAASVRDRTFRSGAPPIDISNIVVLAGVSLGDLDHAESQARHTLDSMRQDVETVTGTDEQVPWLLYALGLGTL